MTTRALLAVTACLLTLSARADDWPQFRGPDRDNVSKEKGLLKAWPEKGPKLAWTYDNAGSGYSGPAIVGDTLYTMGARGDDEYVFALDLTKSPPTEKWAQKIGPTFNWKGNTFNKGPSCTPTVAGDLVIALGAQGELVCVTTAGKEVWRTNLPKDLKGEVNPIGGGPKDIGWGYAGSPLVDGDNVICVPGGPNGTVAALNKMTGKVVWRSKGLIEQATYTSPVSAKIGGKQQYVVMLQDGVAGVDPADGAVLWRYKRNPWDDILASTPLVKNDLVFVSGYKGGSDLVQVTAESGKFTAKKLYADRRLENFVGGLVEINGTIYGCNGGLGGRSEWFAFDVKGQRIVWRDGAREIGKGAVTGADEKLYVVGENGAVALADAAPGAWTLVSFFQLPQTSKLRLSNGKVWTPPVIANGKMYLRDQELIFCYEVK
jgi:outer membrane protein assembly factor BamB